MVLLQTLLDEVSIRASKLDSNSTVYLQCSHCHRYTERVLHSFQCSKCGKCEECGGRDGICQCCFSIEAALKFTVDFKKRELNPENEVAFRKRFRIRIPEDLADPMHWGHLAWQYCTFLKTMSVTTATAAVPP